MSEVAYTKEERMKGIGGSDARKIVSGDWYDLWLEKTGKKDLPNLSNEFPVQLGVWTESFNLKWFEKQMNIEVAHTGLKVSEKKDFMYANVDGLIYGKASANIDGSIYGDNEFGIFEAKHLNGFVTQEKAIETYLPQIHHYMYVFDCNYAWLSIIFGNRWGAYRIEKNEKFMNQLVEKEEQFWSFVVQDKPPYDGEAIETPSTKELVLDKMIVKDMTSSNQWAYLSQTLKQTQEQAREFEASKKEIKSLVQPDWREATGHGVTVKRSKTGRLNITVGEFNAAEETNSK